MPDEKMLTGQSALISGALGDIGQAIAIALATRGADIGLSDILPDEKATELIGKIEALGQKARYDRVDVSDSEAVAAWIKAVQTHLGTSSLIIPNAAIVTVASSMEMTPAAWSNELRINLDGAFFMAQAAAQALLEKEQPGRIIFVGSWAAHRPHTHIPAYSAAKAGVRMLAQCMALELGPKGILVNEVAPGYVNAGLSGKLFKKNPGSAENARKRVPNRKLISADDVAYEVAHLCDPKNLHMNGSVLLMDGGLSLNTRGESDEQ